MENLLLLRPWSLYQEINGNEIDHDDDSGDDYKALVRKGEPGDGDQQRARKRMEGTNPVLDDP